MITINKIYITRYRTTLFKYFVDLQNKLLISKGLDYNNKYTCFDIEHFDFLYIDEQNFRKGINVIYSLPRPNKIKHFIPKFTKYMKRFDGNLKV